MSQVMLHTFGFTAGSLIYWLITVVNMTAEISA